MTLLERLKHLLGNDIDVDVDDDVDIEDVIKNKVRSAGSDSEDSVIQAGADGPDKSDGDDMTGLTEDPNKQVSGVLEAGDVDKQSTSGDGVDTSVAMEVKNDDHQTEGDPGSDGPGMDGGDQQPADAGSVDDKVTIFQDGWFDESTGKVDTTKITDDVVKNAFDMVLKRYSDDRRAGLIDRAVDDMLRSDYLLNISPDRLKSMLDLQQVSVDGDVVSGVKEAIEALKADEPGLFRDKSKESSPLNEGFNPVQKKTTDPHSFLEAMRLQEEIG